MYRMIVMAALFSCLYACAQTSRDPGTKNPITPSSKTIAVEGKDYTIWKRYRIIDKSAFSQPVEAVSFLVPAHWQVQGGVSWNNTRCLSDMVQTSVQARSADGQWELIVYPVTQFDWVNNAQMMDALQRGGYGTGCQIGQPMDASSYLRTVVAKMAGAQVITVTPHRELDQLLVQQIQGAGINGIPTTAEAIMRFPDGRKGLATCYLLRMDQQSPSWDGSTITHTQTVVNQRIVLKYPAGQDDEARRILSTVISSTRINQIWGNAIQTMFNNIRNNVLNENWKRIQITSAAQREISENMVRSWESRSDDQSRTVAQFGQYIRGVDTWTDANGNRVELASGYGSAWSRGDGSFLLTNNTSFDPNVAFQESWAPLSK